MMKPIRGSSHHSSRLGSLRQVLVLSRIAMASATTLLCHQVMTPPNLFEIPFPWQKLEERRCFGEPYFLMPRLRTDPVLAGTYSNLACKKNVASQVPRPDSNSVDFSTLVHVLVLQYSVSPPAADNTRLRSSAKLSRLLRLPLATKCFALSCRDEIHLEGKQYITRQVF